MSLAERFAMELAAEKAAKERQEKEAQEHSGGGGSPNPTPTPAPAVNAEPDAANTEQIWTRDGWVARFGLPFPEEDNGYGHTFAEVSSVQVSSGELLTGYHDAVYEQTLHYVRTLKEADLARVVDDSYDPAVTLGTRLVSVLSDDLQHGGQAALVRGLILNK